MQSLRMELQYAVRSLLRQPGFSAGVILTLALGISTTTAMFSVADTELWRPLRFPNPHELVAISVRSGDRRASNVPLSGAELLDWRAGSADFQQIAAISRTTRRTLRASGAESVTVSAVTPNYFVTLGRPARLGVTERWTETCGPDAGVISDRAWQRIFGGDPAIIGKALRLDEATVVLCGVVPAIDAVGSQPDVYVPLNERSAEFLDRAHPALFEGAIGRLRPGSSVPLAAERLNAIAAHAEADVEARRGHKIVAEDLRDYYRLESSRTRLYFLLGAGGVVLALSWVNAASLLLARAVRRAREFAVRGALGGGRPAIARMLFAEGAVLAGVSGAIAILLAQWTTDILTANLPPDFLRGDQSVHIDLRSVMLAAGLTVLTSIVFAAAPFVASLRIDVAGVLRAGGRSGRSRAEGRATDALLIAQIALTLVLVVGAGIFFRSFLALSRAPLGFDPAGVVAARTTASGSRYESDAAVNGFAGDVADRLRATPGVRSVAVATSSPLGSGPVALLVRPDREKPRAGDETRSIFRAVSPDYFSTLAIRLVRGRAFANSDVSEAPRVAIINEVAAARLFGDEDPIGRDVEILDNARATRWTRRPGVVQVVGIAAKVKEVGINEIDFADIYVPFAQAPSPSMEFVLRSGSTASDWREPVKRAIASVDPAIPVTSLTTFDERVGRELRGDRFNALMVAMFAWLAILLAMVGIHAVMSYAVAGRMPEFGVRLAVGAQPRQLIWLTLMQSGRIGLAGAVVGTVAAVVTARLIGDAWYLVPGAHNGLLYGVSTTDPIVFASAGVAVLAIAVAAASIPARRAGAVDPVRALRVE